MSLRGTKQSHGGMVALYSMRLPRRPIAHTHADPRNDMAFLTNNGETTTPRTA